MANKEIKYDLKVVNKTKKTFKNLDKDAKKSGSNLSKSFGNAFKSLDAKLGGFGSKFGKVFATMGKSIGALVGIFAGVGVAVVALTAKLMKMAAAQAKLNDEIVKNAKKLQLSLTEYQNLSYALQITGTSIESARSSFSRLTGNVGSALQGSKIAEKMFTDLGVSIEYVGGNVKTTGELFTEVTSKLADMDDKGRQAAYAQKLFGRSYQELIPFLNEGSKGIRRLIKDGEKYQTISAEMADASERLTDAQLRLKLAQDKVKNAFLEPIMENTIRVYEKFAELLLRFEPTAKKIGKWINDWMIAPIMEFAWEIKQVVRAVIAMGKTTIEAFKVVGVAIENTFNQMVLSITKSLNDLANKVNPIIAKWNAYIRTKGQQGFSGRIIKESTKKWEDAKLKIQQIEKEHLEQIRADRDAELEALEKSLAKGIITKEKYDKEEEKLLKKTERREQKELDKTAKFLKNINKIIESGRKTFGGELHTLPTLGLINDDALEQNKEDSKDKIDNAMSELLKKYEDWANVFKGVEKPDFRSMLKLPGKSSSTAGSGGGGEGGGTSSPSGTTQGPENQIFVGDLEAQILAFQKDYEKILKDQQSFLSKYNSNMSTIFMETNNEIVMAVGEAFTTLNDITIENFDLIMTKSLEMADVYQMVGDSIIAVNNAIGQVLSNKSNERIEDMEEEKRALEDKFRSDKQALADRRISQRKFDREMIKLENEKAKKEEEIRKKQEEEQKKAAKAQLVLQLLSAIANTALGVTQALALGPPQGFVLAAITAAMGAVSVGVIGAQLAKFAEGGIVGGNSPSGDKNVVRANSGEMILTKQQQRNLFEIANNKNDTGMNSSQRELNITIGETIVQGNADMNTVNALNESRDRQTDQLREMLEEMNFKGTLNPIVVNALN